MDIQGYILDRWMAKMKAESPVLTIYDKDGLYYDILPLAAEKGIKVIDTTKGLLHARLSASRFWSNELSLNKDSRMIIYRKRPMPTNNRGWVEEPFVGFIKSGGIFPFGAEDRYENICTSFISPAKHKELKQLFANGTTSFNMINALLEGAAFPSLEQLTGGKSTVEITVNLLSLASSEDLKWQSEWKNFAEIQYPGLDASGLSLKDIQMKLWAYLLFSEFVFDLPEAIPSNLQSVAIAPIEMKDKIFLICDKLRNQINLRETYVKYANKVAEQLNLSEIFTKSKHLGNRVTFGFENSVEYDRFIAYLKEGKQAEAHKLCNKNINDVWYQEDSEISSFWKLASNALLLTDCINRGLKSDGNLQELVDWYAHSGCDADYAFRRFHTERLGVINSPKQVKELTDFVNSRYQEFTERAVKVYQNTIKELKDCVQLKNQGCVQEVYPALQAGKRVVLVMVDAFRYEMGKNFAQSIEKRFKDRVKYEPKISYLPSVTRFGMANHLNNIVLDVQSGKLQPMIDSKVVASPEDRIDYLRAKTGVEVQDVRLEDFDPSAINENTHLLVVRSVGIDTAGENDKLNGLASMERELIRLARLTDDCKKLKFDQAVFVTDHGYMLLPAFNTGNLISKPAGSDIVLEESRVLAGNLNETSDTVSFTPTQLGEDIAVMKLSYAKDFTVFKRGEVYFHEGLSLQENVVPIIKIDLQEKKEKSQFSLSLTYKGKTDGTIFTRRPIINIIAHFTNLFAEDVSIKLKVTGDNNQVIGTPEGMLYNDVTECIDISPSIEQCRQLICIDDEYQGSTVTITALDAETNATLSTLKLNFEND